MNDTFMKEKAIFPLLTSMALPMVVSMLVNALYNIVDSLFVARISEEAMTALSLVYPVQNLINAIAIGFSIGIAALISLHLGAGNKEKADMAATHGMVLSLIHGVVISIVCTAIMPRFLRSFTSDETVIAMGVTYSRVAFMFAVVIMAAMSFEKIFQAVGRMNITMIGLMGGSVCNIILDPLLIFGIGPFPKMGIAGAALATGIGQMVPVIFYLIVYFVSPIPVRLRSGCLKPDAKMALQLYSIGVPAILNLALPSVLITFLNSLLAVYSQSYVVVLGIYYKLQTFLYLPANGIVQGLRPIIGYNYGACRDAHQHAAGIEPPLRGEGRDLGLTVGDRGHHAVGIYRRHAGVGADPGDGHAPAAFQRHRGRQSLFAAHCFKEQVVLVQRHTANVRSDVHCTPHGLPVGSQRRDGGTAGSLCRHQTVFIYRSHLRVGAQPLVNINKGVVIVDELQLFCGVEIVVFQGKAQAALVQSRLFGLAPRALLGHRHLAGCPVPPV